MDLSLMIVLAFFLVLICGAVYMIVDFIICLGTPIKSMLESLRIKMKSYGLRQLVRPPPNQVVENISAEKLRSAFTSKIPIFDKNKVCGVDTPQLIFPPLVPNNQVVLESFDDFITTGNNNNILRGTRGRNEKLHELTFFNILIRGP